MVSTVNGSGRRRPTNYIGRVGALAVALGVGGVIAGLPLAAADNGVSSDSGATQSSADNSSSTRSGNRAGSPARTQRGDAAQADSEATAGGRPVRGAVRSGGAPAPADSTGSRRSSDAVSDADELDAVLSDGSPAAPSSDATDAVAPAPDAGPAPVVITAVPVTGDVPAAAAVVVPRIAQVAAPAAAEVPVMTAAGASGSVAATPLTGLLDWLGGPGRTDLPAAATLAWAAAAASRRELSAAVTTVAPAAATTTGEPATLSDQIAALGILAGLPDQIRTEIGQVAAGWIENAFGASAVTQVSSLISGLGSSPSVSEVLSGIGDAVTEWWDDAGIAEQLGGVVDSLTGGVFATPAGLAALLDAAVQIATAADPGAVVRDAFFAMLDAPTISDAIDETLSGALAVLTNQFGPSVSDAVSALLADPVLGDLAGSVFGFLGEPGVSAALAGAAREFASAVLTGSDLNGALAAAWAFVQADPAVQAVIDLAVSDVVGSLLDNESAMQVIGDGVTQLVAGLAGDAALGELAGSVLTGFIGSPGVPAALAGVAGDVVTALLGGADLGEAALGAWNLLQASPEIQTAVETALSGVAGGLLNDAETVDYLTGAVSGLFTGLLGDAAVSARVADQIVTLMVSVILDGPAAVDEFAGPITELLTDLIVAADPASADLAPAIAAAGFALLRAGLIGDLGTVPGTIAGLATDATVLANLSERIGDLGALIGLPEGVPALLGDAAAYLIENSLGDPVVTQALTPVFGAISFPNGTTAVIEYLNDLVQNGFDPQSAFGDLLGPEVPAALAVFLADAEVQQAFGDALSGAVGILADAALEAIAADGGMIGTALTGLLSAIQGDLATAAGSALMEFLSQPGIDDALASGAVEAILAAISGGPAPDMGSVLDAAGAALIGALGSLLTDGGVAEALSVAVADLVGGFAADADVQTLIGDQITALLSSVVGDASVAADIGAAVSDALLGLLVDSAVGEGLGALAGSLISGLLGQDGIEATLIQVGGDLLTAVMSGTDPADAVSAAWEALQADPGVSAALAETLAAALDTLGTTVFGNAGVQEALGSTVATLLTGLADDTTVQSVIGDLLGSDFGPTVVGLLADPSFGAATAGLLGSAVTDLLGYPGVGAALTDTLEQALAAILAGDDPAAALSGSVQALAANPVLQAALDAVLPGYLDSILVNEDIREGVGAIAQQVVTDLLTNSGIVDPGTATTAGRVVEAATVSLLANPAFGGLLTDLASDIANGTPVSEVTTVVVQAVLRDPALQGALGTAIGQGIGSLVGDNVVGAIVGQVAGAVATLVIGVAAGLTMLFNPALAGAAAASRPGGGYFELVPALNAQVSSITVTVTV